MAFKLDIEVNETILENLRLNTNETIRSKWKMMFVGGPGKVNNIKISNSNFRGWDIGYLALSTHRILFFSTNLLYDEYYDIFNSLIVDPNRKTLLLKESSNQGFSFFNFQKGS